MATRLRPKWLWLGGNVFIAEGTLEIGKPILNTDSNANILTLATREQSSRMATI